MKRLVYAAPALAVFFSLPFNLDPVGILGVLGALAGLIFVHELGHFLAAKRMGMPVETFSLGFGPRIVGFKWNETDVRLSLLPLGGYVKLAGYNPEEPDAEDPHGFLQQPYRKRMLFYAGGIIFNLLAAFLCLWVVSADRSRITQESIVPTPLKVGQVLPKSPAKEAGLQRGDQIQAIGPLAFPPATTQEAITHIQARPGQAIPIKVLRGDQALDLSVTPTSTPEGRGKVGVEFSQGMIRAERRPMALTDIGRGFRDGLLLTAKGTWGILKGFGHLFTGRAKVTEMGGPGTIAKMAYENARSGWIEYLGFLAFISINLAVLNALPIPALDGGHMALLSFERLRGRELSIKLKERILTAGFVFLMGLMLLVIGLDVWRPRQ